MPFKNILKKNPRHSERSTNVGSPPHLGFRDQRPTALRPATRASDEAGLVEECLATIELQKLEIGKLKDELNIRESTLDDFLRQVDTPRVNAASQSNELQVKTEEVNSLKHILRESERTLQEHVQNAQEMEQALTNLELQFEAALKNFKDESERQINRNAASTQRLEHQLSEERQRFTLMKASFESKIASERERCEKRIRTSTEAENRAKRMAEQLREQLNVKGQRIDELDEELHEERQKSERMKESFESERATEQQEHHQRYQALIQESEEAESQARRVAEQIGEQLGVKGLMIHELNEQVDQLRLQISDLGEQSVMSEQMIQDLQADLGTKVATLAEVEEKLDLATQEMNEQRQRLDELEERVLAQSVTIQEKTIALNSATNELNIQKRKSREAIEGAAMKDKYLDFVQQQCLILKDQLRLANDKI